MHARIGTVQMTPETFEQGVKIIETQALPSLRLMEGFKGALILADEEAAKALFLSLWESEEAMRKSETEVAVLREDSADALGVGGIPVERFDVRLIEIEDG
jgi:heme-degrading monooxygenase HmoA